MIQTTWSPYLKGVLRIVAAFSFITHGTQKLFAMPVLEARATAELLSLFGAAGVIEAVGGALMLLGLFTRPVGILLCGQMAAAYFIAHAPHGFWPILNGGELASIYCLLWLYFSASGPGAFSLDEMRRRRGV